MQFDSGRLYHVYNQGNNRQKIFFTQDNYLYFLKKMRTYICPYADILAWCLMPNHFHIMIEVKHVNLQIGKADKKRSLNESIAILLRSYTRAINKAQKRSGSLFRGETKAICLDEIDQITNAYFINNGITCYHTLEEDYAQSCFNYIHKNPSQSGLESNAGTWQFSSLLDYMGSRNGNLINKTRSKELDLF